MPFELPLAMFTSIVFVAEKKLDIKKQINLLVSFSGHDIKVANNKGFRRGTRISKYWWGKAYQIAKWQLPKFVCITLYLFPILTF